MTSQELRKKFLGFFEKKGHRVLPSAPLVPENDPTVLFTTAGMHPLVPYLLGQPHALGQRLCNSQKCIRTGDIDDVGDNTHVTFFEMLGNWSLGNYFKREAIEWSFEFLTKELNLSLDKLAFTVFEGLPSRSSEGAKAGESIPRDNEAVEIWQSLGVSKDRIAYLGREDNWWGPAGQTGPCGPDTEMFYWTGEEPAPKKFIPSDKRWVEIWNNVFMQYNKKIKNQKSKIKIEYEFIPLKQKNVDTGMGLERTLAVLNGKSNVYETDLFESIMKNIDILCHSETERSERFDTNKAQVKNSGCNRCQLSVGRDPSVGVSRLPQDDVVKAKRIIADHIKAATFILAEGVVPSNVERGYVARRLIRRAIRYGKILGIEQGFTPKIAQAVIQIYQDIYPEVKNNQQFIFEELKKEEEKFSQKLGDGIKALKKIFGRAIGGVDPENLPQGMCIEGNKLRVDGSEIFHLYETYGLPLEISQEIMTGWGVAFDEQTMQEAKDALAKHQELSRTASAGKFKSGLADHSRATVKLHTAAHLLHQALRQVLGSEVHQAGSNITPERLRFDFSYSRKLTDAELTEIEKIVNAQIQLNLPVKCETMPYQQAIDSGALAFFKDRYPEKVNVYSIGPAQDPGQVFSREVCAGPHAEGTGELGKFKILKQESVGANLRRIKAVLK